MGREPQAHNGLMRMDTWLFITLRPLDRASATCTGKTCQPEFATQDSHSRILRILKRGGKLEDARQRRQSQHFKNGRIHYLVENLHICCGYFSWLDGCVERLSFGPCLRCCIPVFLDVFQLPFINSCRNRPEGWPLRRVFGPAFLDES